jgi:hypothetical protein
VPQHFRNFRERCAASEHLRRRSSTKAVRPDRREPCSLRRRKNDSADRTKRTMRRPLSKKDASRLGIRPLDQVRAESMSDVVWKRETFALRSLSMNDDLAVSPVDVLERKCSDFSRAQSKSREQEKNRQCATSTCGLPIAASKQTRDVLFVDSARERAIAPPDSGRN